MRLLLLITLLAPALLRAAELPKELRARFPAKVEKQLLAIQAKGEPLLLREIAAWLPAVPDNQNAAEHLQHLNELLKDDKVFKQRMALSKKRRELKLVGFDPLPDEYLVELKKMLESQRAILEAIHETVTRKQFKSNEDFEKGQSRFVRELLVLKTASNLLTAEATWRAHQRKASAGDSLLAQIVMAKYLDNEPTLIARLVQTAVIGISLQPTSRVLSADVLTAKQLKALQLAHARIDVPSLMPRTYASERCLLTSKFFLPKKELIEFEKGVTQFMFFPRPFDKPEQALKERTDKHRHQDLSLMLAK